MINYGNVEVIDCPACNQQHESQLVAFPLTLKYREQDLHLPEYYHACPETKTFIQTSRDVIETWKAERQLKKQVDQQLDQPQQQWDPNGPSIVNGYPIGMTMNINGQNMAWTGREWVRV